MAVRVRCLRHEPGYLIARHHLEREDGVRAWPDPEAHRTPHQKRTTLPRSFPADSLPGMKGQAGKSRPTRERCPSLARRSPPLALSAPSMTRSAPCSVTHIPRPTASPPRAPRAPSSFHGPYGPTLPSGHRGSPLANGPGRERRVDLTRWRGAVIGMRGTVKGGAGHCRVAGGCALATRCLQGC